VNLKRTVRIAKCLSIASLLALSIGLLPVRESRFGGLLGPAVAQGQNFSQRTIQGKVLDDTETPVSGSTVFLKNVKTRSVKSFTSTDDGSFRFAQVGMIDDYEVWAEHNGKRSATKTVSSFDSRKQVDFDLKLK